jgi:hypothetical protein
MLVLQNRCAVMAAPTEIQNRDGRSTAPNLTA